MASYTYFPTGIALLAASNDSVTSFNGKYRAIMQSDGNFVLYNLMTGDALFSTETTGEGQRAIMQSDGNFVVYDGSGNALFSSDTAPQPAYAAFLRLQDDGNLVMYEYKKESIWATDTAA